MRALASFSSSRWNILAEAEGEVFLAGRHALLNTTLTNNKTNNDHSNYDDSS